MLNIKQTWIVGHQTTFFKMIWISDVDWWAPFKKSIYWVVFCLGKRVNKALNGTYLSSMRIMSHTQQSSWWEIVIHIIQKQIGFCSSLQLGRINRSYNPNKTELSPNNFFTSLHISRIFIFIYSEYFKRQFFLKLYSSRIQDLLFIH